MAFTAGAYWEVQSGGSDSSGGGFDTGVAGFLADWAIASANTSAPVVTSASYNFVAGDVGAWFFLKSGTSSIPGWYIIVSVASNAATLNATIGQGVLFNATGTNGTPSTVLGCGTAASLTSQTGGIDFSQQAAAEIAYADMLVGATTTQFTSVTNPVNKRIIGNIINVVSGATVQRVAVTATTTITATCDKSLGTAAQVGVGNLGGAFLSPALPASVAIASNNIFIKSGSYSITSASTNVAGGCWLSSVVPIRLEGYGSIRGDLGTAPVLTASGISTFIVIAASAGSVGQTIRNLTVDCAGLTASTAFQHGTGIGVNLFAKNCTNGGFASTSLTGVLIRCRATGCSAVAAFAGASCILCQAYGNTITGFITVASSNCHFVFCSSFNNTGASTDGFSSTAQRGVAFINCVAYANDRDGFRVATRANSMTNCIAESNVGTGFNCSLDHDYILNCAAFSNGTNITNSTAFGMTVACIIYTASAFVNAASGNFSLNGTSGGGASLRSAGIPGISPDGLVTGYQDMGAYQSPPMVPMARVFAGM